MTVQIVDAREELIPQIQKIEQQSFSMPWTEPMLRLQLDPNSHLFLTAEAEGKVVGYVGLMYVLDEGYISNVAVHPDYRRRGIAQALVRELAKRAEAKFLSFVTLEVRESNEGARALYEKCGFKIVGRRKNYYEKPTEDAILMTLHLG